MLVHKFIMKAGSNIFASALSFVALMVMTRYVGEQYGIMMWGWAFIAMFNAFSDLGFNTANMRYISRPENDQSVCFSTFVAIKVMLSVATLLMSAVSVAVSVASGSMSGESLAVCIVFMVYFLMYNIQTALTITFDGRLESGKSSLALTVEYTVRSVILIVLALMGVDAVTLCTAYVVGIVVSVCATLLMLRNTGLRLRRPTLIGKYAAFAAPLAISIMSIAFIEYLDKVLIGIYHGSLETGYYTAAFGVVGAFTTLGTSLNNTLLPHLSKTSGGDRSGAENTLWMAEKYISVLLLPVLAFIMVLGTPVASVLFGSDYAASGDILSIQTIHIFTFIFTGMMAQVLYSVNKSRIYLNGSLVFSAIALVGFFVLIPDSILGLEMADLSGVGASLSLAIAYVVFSVYLAFMTRKVVGFRLYPRLWRVFAAAAVGGLFLVAVDSIHPITGLVSLAVFGILSEIVFLVALKALGELKKEDVDFIRTALNIRKIRESASEEWK